MSDALAGVNSMVSSLNDSINQAIAAVQAQSQAATAASNVQEFQKSASKSTSNLAGQATDIGVLAKGTTRLNVVSSLAANDKVDFYKFRVTSKGEATLGEIGDDGVRVQVMTKLGTVVADSNKDAGDEYKNYQSLQHGTFALDKGDYTLRVTRDKDVSEKESKNYALQLSMGGYTQDFDTIAKQPDATSNPYQLSEATQTMLSGLSTAASNLASTTFGQTGTEKLMGSFSLFV